MADSKTLSLLRTIQILKDHSDSNHPLTQQDIIDYLEKEYGIIVERKTIGRNISLLKEAGYDILSTRGGSFLDVREFTDSELHLLIDGVLACRHITASFSKDLIERLCSLSNEYFQANVKHIRSIKDWGKTENQALFYNIEVLDEAIDKHKQVQYTYNKYNLNKKLEKSSTQVVSPYTMILHNQHYYLMAYSSYWNNMVYHRLDHMTNIQKLDEKAVPLKTIPGYENGVNYKNISSSMPYMFNDEPKSIDMKVDRAILDQLVDWFGTDFKASECDKDPRHLIVSLKASPKAMVYWALQYCQYAEILTPKELRKDVADALEKANKTYKVK